MSEFNELQDLITKVNNGKLDKNCACGKVLSIIFENPYLFSLEQLDEEDLIDFLDFIYQKIFNIFSVYDCSQGSFKNFIVGCIKIELKAFHRSKYKSYIEKKCQNRHLDYLYSEITELYNSDKIFDDESPDLCYDFGEADEIEWEPFSNLNKVAKQQSVLKIAQKAAFILALKTCNSLSELEIERISMFVGIKKDYLKSVIKNLTDDMNSSFVNKEKFLSSRDSAYYYHCVYGNRLSTLVPGTEIYKDIKAKYEKRTESWNKKNAYLSSASRFKLSPSNRKIAQVLGISESQVAYYIRQALKCHVIEKVLKIDNIKLN